MRSNMGQRLKQIHSLFTSSPRASVDMGTQLLVSLKHPPVSLPLARSAQQTSKWLFPLASRETPPLGLGRTSSSAGFALQPRLQNLLGCASIHTCGSVEHQGVELEVDVSVEGKPLGGRSSILEDLASAMQKDALAALGAVLEHNEQFAEKHVLPKEMVELSIVLCDDSHIANLNKEWRGKESPTDVLSFPMGDDDDDQEDLPVQMLGDLVISMDTADRQAQDQKIDLLSECRILLLHGLLHLVGFDHDRSREDWIKMANAEEKIMRALAWEGKGLITTADGHDPHPQMELLSSARTVSEGPIISLGKYSNDIQMVAIDMDGTLLSSQLRILNSSRFAIMNALSRGVKMILATGKARPGAMAACAKAGLSGDGLLVSTRGPGVFLQGLSVYDWGGSAFVGPNLPSDLVKSVFQYCERTNISCVAFIGDECCTTKMTDDVKDMHHLYYEPLAKELPISDILAGPSVKKMLLMEEASRIQDVILPYWSDRATDSGAALMTAVENHLEIVPKGVNKWAGVRKLVESAGLPMDSVMSIGDGGNDAQMVAGTGIGVAMGNAVAEVKRVADVIVASNDDGGVAEALERFVV